MVSGIGLFGAIVLIGLVLIICIVILLFAFAFIFGGTLGLPVFIRDLQKNWEKMSGTDILKSICIIIVIVAGLIYVIQA